MKFLNVFLVLALFAGCSKNSGTTSPTNTHIISSAVSGGVINNASTLQQEIDSCNAAGPNGGTVELTAGTYMTGPIYMLSNVTLQLDAGATLLGDPTMSDYTISNKVVDLIRSGSSALTNVSIIGKGTIDGNGAAWWTAFNQNPNLTRPRLVYISSCTNLTLDGITLQNSPSFHFVPYQCTNVTVNNITVLAPSNSPNTDGIDPSQCNGVTITNCTVDNGDDDIAIKAAGLCQNITVKNCTFKHGHGLSIGSETNGGMTGLTVDSCTFTGTTNGIRLKSYTSAGGPMTNLNYSNITMTGVTHPLIITLDYSNEGGGTTNVPSVKGFAINNLTATGSGDAGTLVGLSNSILQNITLSNINISTLNNTPMIITDANAVTITNASINGVTVAPGSGNIIATNVTGSTGF
jgi:polygalacturonase